MSETPLEITRAQVRQDGQLLARLSYSGKMITVVLPSTKRAGRLFPAGYLDGKPDTGTGLFDVWTARHPAVHTPSDRRIGQGLPLADAIGLLLFPPAAEEAS